MLETNLQTLGNNYQLFRQDLDNSLRYSACGTNEIEILEFFLLFFLFCLTSGFIAAIVLWKRLAFLPRTT